MAHQEGYFRVTETPSFPRLGGLVRGGGDSVRRWLSSQHRVTRRVMVGAILTLALLAFELFNYDTTEYALEDLLGAISFGNVRWATILAIAFCSIDFAGLAQLIAPDRGGGAAPDSRLVRPSWLLLGAWLLGGGMNAIMTWWAVSLALMRHNLGNEVLTREELIRLAPIFVAVLVWITRILLISSFSMTASQRPVRSGGGTERRITFPSADGVIPSSLAMIARSMSLRLDGSKGLTMIIVASGVEMVANWRRSVGEP